MNTSCADSCHDSSRIMDNTVKLQATCMLGRFVDSRNTHSPCSLVRTEMEFGGEARYPSVEWKLIVLPARSKAGGLANTDCSCFELLFL